MTMGVNYSWSVIKKALVADWHWTNVEASLPFTIYTAIFALAMVIGGRIQDKAGPRSIATMGGVLLGTGLISCSFSSTPLSLLLAYSVAGIGNGICYSSTIPASIKWFAAEKKGFVTGIVVSGIGLASAYFSPIANWLISRFGVSGTFLFLGMGAFSTIMILAQFLGNPPAGYNPPAKTEGPSIPAGGTVPDSEDIDWTKMTRTALFYKLWFMLFFSASAGLMVIGHIATIAKTQAGWEKGFYLVIIFAVFNTAGRMTAGFFSDKYGRLNLMRLGFVLQGINLLFFPRYSTPLLLALGTILTGLSYGAFFALFPPAIADFFGVKNFGVNYGLVFLAWGFAGILGPILAGWSADVTGTYFIAYMVSAVLLFSATFLAYTIRQAASAADE